MGNLGDRGCTLPALVGFTGLDYDQAVNHTFERGWVELLPGDYKDYDVAALGLCHLTKLAQVGRLNRRKPRGFVENSNQTVFTIHMFG